MKAAAIPVVLVLALAMTPGLAGAASPSPSKGESKGRHSAGSPWGGGNVDLSLGSVYVGELGRGLRRHLDNGPTAGDWRAKGNVSAEPGSIASISSSIDAVSLAGYTVYSLTAMPFTLLRGKAGLLYHEVTETDACASVIRCDLSEGVSTSSIFGFGAAYRLGKNINILGGYTVVESDLSRLAIGLNYSFE